MAKKLTKFVLRSFILLVILFFSSSSFFSFPFIFNNTILARTIVNARNKFISHVENW